MPGGVRRHAAQLPPGAAIVDPCKSRDAQSCSADDRCEILAVGVGCDCAQDVPCTCPPVPAPSCSLKSCGELTDTAECSARPDCTTTPPVLFEGMPTPASGGSTSGGSTQPRSAPMATSCFSLGDCQQAAESDCAKMHACVAIYDAAGKFARCDWATACTSSADCATGQRCNAGGRCVVEGCAGDDENECNADKHCEPIYALNCSPYANGGGGGFCGPNGAGGGAPLPDEALPPGSCTCEPTFSGCQDASHGCDTGKSVMVRDPAILDDPFWALPRVLTSITGADASVVADAWLTQLGTTATVGGQTAAARTARRSSSPRCRIAPTGSSMPRGSASCRRRCRTGSISPTRRAAARRASPTRSPAASTIAAIA